MLNTTSSAGAPQDSQISIILSRLDQSQHPYVYPYVSRLLVGLGIIYLVIIGLALVILATPFLRGSASRKKNIWLWRKQYLSSRPTPYYIPNGGLSIVISQLWSSVLFEVYIYLSYRALQDPQATLSTYRYFWLTVSYTPCFTGFWFSGFSALYICLLSPERPTIGGVSSRGSMLHPAIMNSACVGVPVLVTLTAIQWGIVSIRATHERVEAYQAVVAQVASGQDFSNEMARYTLAIQRFVAQFRWASLTWSIAALIEVSFYSYTITIFLRLLKTTVDVASGKRNLLVGCSSDYNSTLEGPSRSPALTSERIGGTQTVIRALSGSKSSKNLKRNYRMLLLHCTLLTVVLVWHLIVGIALTIKIGSVIDNIAWRSVCIWVTVSSSVLSSVVLLLQSWKLLSETSESPTRFMPTKQSDVSMPENILQLQMAEPLPMTRPDSFVMIDQCIASCEKCPPPLVM
ncbi:uncharacterized protein MELLADRAFT_115495 [Melampsora larici-populina 98AG31]|uniref:Uncharacterized protein n=1 Tax=Melampsora larici-populina (strain 98AG31 / pathotype 3-4-7) TaxID=747676 RepID=F4R9Z6_MELLP|nr:uncharacterized protein MELLADRAFT_115495 [Melampsora larici-populina 98AG31]EGG10658.1 hypothetical protein MELLADRAFT_115495 [Melampsora larici-populina 98AG31]